MVLPWTTVLSLPCFTQWARSAWHQGEVSSWSSRASSPLPDNFLRPQDSLAKQPQTCFQGLEQPPPKLYPDCKPPAGMQFLVLKGGQGTALLGVEQVLDVGAGVATYTFWMPLSVRYSWGCEETMSRLWAGSLYFIMG